jgi:type 1 glutamine amidotransferase
MGPVQEANPMSRSRASFALALILLLGSALAVAAAGGPGAAPGKDIRVLVLSGQSNHDWKSTTPKLVGILQSGGRSEVDVCNTPGTLTARDLAPYDVLVSHWNAFGLDPAASAWPEETKRAYLDFVRRGKGHVVVHAGSASFADWPEYLELTLGTWKPGQSSHGPSHEFPVRMEDVRHPVTAGLAPFTTYDELWNAPGLADGAEVLASSYSAPDQGGTGRWEPSVLAGRYGQGRSLTILLGHDAAAMDNAGFQALLLRAVEWAATGRVAPAPAAAPAGPWRWEMEGSSLALVGPGGPLWRFRYGQALDHVYFHPLRTTSGKLMTWDRPPDHIWHHGLWFSWKYINRVNYWEVDPKTGHPAGRTSWSNVRVSFGRALEARITLDLDYRPVGAPSPVLTEKRTTVVSRPDAEGVYTIDWNCAFTAHADALLDRTPLPGQPGGGVSGGYAGLSLRLGRGLSDRQVMTSDGPVTVWTDDRYRARHVGLDYAGLIGGEPAGIAIVDHPSNPRSPTPWYVISSPGFSWFTPALLCHEPLALRAGDALVLRYRVFVHDGRWGAERLRREAARFAADKE